MLQQTTESFAGKRSLLSLSLFHLQLIVVRRSNCMVASAPLLLNPATCCRLGYSLLPHNMAACCAGHTQTSIRERLPCAAAGWFVFLAPEKRQRVKIGEEERPSVGNLIPPSSTGISPRPTPPLCPLSPPFLIQPSILFSKGHLTAHCCR